METPPIVIDANYVVGFDRTRNWQLRLVEDWNKVAWFGISVESPQINFLSNSLGANAIIALRCCRLSHRFQNYWAERSPAA